MEGLHLHASGLRHIALQGAYDQMARNDREAITTWTPHQQTGQQRCCGS